MTQQEAFDRFNDITKLFGQRPRGMYYKVKRKETSRGDWVFQILTFSQVEADHIKYHLERNGYIITSEASRKNYFLFFANRKKHDDGDDDILNPNII